MDSQAQDRLKPGLHPVYSRFLCAYLQAQGHRDSAIFAGTRLHWNELANEHRYLSLEQLARLVRRARALTGQHAIGLDVACTTSVSAHGALGYAVVSAPTLGAMVDVLVRYVGIRLRWISLSCSLQGDQLCLQVHECLDLGECREFIVGSLIGTFMQMIRAVTPQPPAGITVQLPYDSPSIRSRYDELLSWPVDYGKPAFTIALPADCLAQPCLTADAAIHRNALRDCDHQLASLNKGGPLSQQISIALLDQEGVLPTLEEMAGRFAMSSRSLIRKLKTEQTRYQQLRDEVRQEQALWLLQETRLPIEQIAERLGYQDTSNFSRTFRRWFGETPLAVRKQVQ